MGKQQVGKWQVGKWQVKKWPVGSGEMASGEVGFLFPDIILYIMYVFVEMHRPLLQHNALPLNGQQGQS